MSTFVYVIQCEKVDKNWKSKNICSEILYVKFSFDPNEIEEEYVDMFGFPTLFWDYSLYSVDENNLIEWTTLRQNRTQLMRDQIAVAL